MRSEQPHGEAKSPRKGSPKLRGSRARQHRRRAGAWKNLHDVRRAAGDLKPSRRAGRIQSEARNVWSREPESRESCTGGRLPRSFPLCGSQMPGGREDQRPAFSPSPRRPPFLSSRGLREKKEIFSGTRQAFFLSPGDVIQSVAIPPSARVVRRFPSPSGAGSPEKRPTAFGRQTHIAAFLSILRKRQNANRARRRVPVCCCPCFGLHAGSCARSVRFTGRSLRLHV